MNKDNLKYLVLGLLLGAFSMKSMEMSRSSAQETMSQITSVDTRSTLTKIASSFGGLSDTAAGNSSVHGATASVPPGAIPLTTSAESAITGAVPEIGAGINDTIIQDVVRHPGVVIAVKIHGDAFVPEIKQSFCLLHAAYNNRVLYDVVLFATIKLPDDDVAAIQQIIHPAKLIVQYDEQTLQEQIADMTPAQQQILVNRCSDANTTADLTWHHRCRDGRHVMPIAYCWMSEFRSKQIWHQKVLAPYKYMMWYDSDSFATQVWRQDPIDYMVRNDLVLLTANYAQSTTNFKSGVQTKLFEVYNKTFCDGNILPNGRLDVRYGGDGGCRNAMKQVHGFFHITNLDFYRLPINLHWSDVQIADHKFSRVWDDQLAVAVPASMLAPNRTAEMEISGLKLEVMHNGMMMGKRKWIGGAFKKFFKTEGVTKFPEAQNVCSHFITVPSR